MNFGQLYQLSVPPSKQKSNWLLVATANLQIYSLRNLSILNEILKFFQDGLQNANIQN
jgi:hypothetical protein